MAYTHEDGRRFWEAFDRYFKFESGGNGMAALYSQMGGYSGPSQQWMASISAGNMADFDQYVQDVAPVVTQLAIKQEEHFQQYFQSDPADICLAFQDFAFGVLASPKAPYRGSEPVHMMNGSRFAQDYLSWHGFITAAVVCRPGVALWPALRWINGMAWELQVKAAPSESYPNTNKPLAQTITDEVKARWKSRTQAQIDEAFSHYFDRTRTFKAERLALMGRPGALATAAENPPPAQTGHIAGIVLYEQKESGWVGQWSHVDTGGALCDEEVPGADLNALPGRWPVSIKGPGGSEIFAGTLMAHKLGECIALEWEGKLADGKPASFIGLGRRTGSTSLAATFQKT
jgi:hypothetical protein